jgi:polyisoprenoid-binding protein YceI
MIDLSGHPRLGPGLAIRFKFQLSSATLLKLQATEVDIMPALTTELGLDAGTWTIDPAHSEVAFVIRHLMTKVRGSFTEFSGALEIAEKIEDSRVNVEIKVDSIDTRQSYRDTHIRSSEILDVENHPVMKFVATGVRPDGDAFLVDGDLTVRDVTLPVTLTTEFNGTSEDMQGKQRVGFSAATSISRKEYGVEFNVPLGGDKALLSDKVDIQLEVQAVKE